MFLRSSQPWIQQKLNTKKDNIEYDILSCIFEEGKQCEIVKSEQPDFILKFQSVSVGVEITELYFDSTSARLKNKQGYIKDLVEKNKFAHKDDKDKLSIKEVTYFSQSAPNAPFHTKMVFHHNYSVDDYRASLLQAIRKKGKKFEKYNNSVHQSALVIYDQESFFRKFYRQDFVRILFDNAVVNTIKESPFDEIYLVTRFKDLPDEYYVQFKYCLLQNELSVLLEFIEKNNLNKKLKELNLSANDCFAEVLVKKGYKAVKMSVRNSMPVVCCNRYSFFADEENRKMSVFDNFPNLLDLGDSHGIVNNENLFSEKAFNKFLKETKNQLVSFDVGFRAIKNRMQYESKT